MYKGNLIEEKEGREQTRFPRVLRRVGGEGFGRWRGGL